MSKFFSTKEVSKIMGYSCPKAFCFAAKKAVNKKKDNLLVKIWESRIPNLRYHKWLKTTVNKTIEASNRAINNNKKKPR